MGGGGNKNDGQQIARSVPIFVFAVFEDKTPLASWRIVSFFVFSQTPYQKKGRPAANRKCGHFCSFCCNVLRLNWVDGGMFAGAKKKGNYRSVVLVRFFSKAIFEKRSPTQEPLLYKQIPHLSRQNSAIFISAAMF